MSTTFLDVKAICLNPRDGGGGGGARCGLLSPGSGSHYRDRTAPRRPCRPPLPGHLPLRLTRYRAGTAFYLEYSAFHPPPPHHSPLPSSAGGWWGTHRKSLHPTASLPPSCAFALLGGGGNDTKMPMSWWCTGSLSPDRLLSLGGFLRDMSRHPST